MAEHRIAPYGQTNYPGAYNQYPEYPNYPNYPNYQPYPSVPEGQYQYAYHQPPQVMVQPPPSIMVPSAVVVYGHQFHCRQCGYVGAPAYSRRPSATAWISCFLLFLLCWPLMCIPFCIDDCYERHPSCPNH